ncbi:hypothetical protein PAHAL_9G001500 [Panicum hallii]|uniref:Uncharacterized protein n=1 Tax=Panicum hallii TaxID=206008 RepID=A0A2S3IFY3_9POAL|nr:hypothetical protein PAHAL_9G001500 [Panicum hallii]
MAWVIDQIPARRRRRLVLRSVLSSSPCTRARAYLLQQASACGRPCGEIRSDMAATSVQAAAVLCLVVLAASPRAALGNCRNDCNAACNGWPVVCQLSCASACMGEVGISTLSTTAAAPAKDPASAPAPAPAQQGGGVSVLRGLKPSSAAHGDGDAPTN